MDSLILSTQNTPVGKPPGCECRYYFAFFFLILLSLALIFSSSSLVKLMLAMPIMATSFIQMAYSLTDMAWVGRLGSEAIAAVGSVGLLTWMTTSLALLNKVGSEVSVGQAIGMKDETAARSFATHNLTLSLIVSVAWAFILFTFATPQIPLFQDPITGGFGR